MTEINLKSIKEARERISTLITPTPVLGSLYLQRRIGIQTFLKLENLNLSGSFKIRGAANALMKADKADLKKGVVTASAGNHAQGVAHICQRLGVKSHIFMPKLTPMIKVESTRALGAHIELVGDTYDDAYQAALKFQKDEGGMMIHPFANADVICGQGSIALELMEQVKDIGLVVVPIGGGGLISGIACAMKEMNPKVKVIGVQSKAYPAMQLSIEKGEPVAVKPGPTIADGIAVKNVQNINLQLVKKYVDDIITVDEESIAASIMDLMERNHLLAEGAGATSVAGMLHLPMDIWRDLGGKVAVCIISGGNIDVNLVRRITTRGLIRSGRLVKMRVKLKDTPGSLGSLLTELGKQGANLMEVVHNRLFSTAHFSEVEVDLDLETTNNEHCERVKDALTKAGYTYSLIG